MSRLRERTTTPDRVAVIKALAHPTRLAIAERLLGGERCVCELHEEAGGDFSTISKHLALMVEAGWLIAEKRGANVYYQLACTCLTDFLHCVDQLASSPCCQPRKPTKP